MSASGKKLYEFEPGELPENPVFRDLQLMQCRAHCRFYTQTGDELHLWRAWRVARAILPMSNACLDVISPHIDAISQRRRSTRADQALIRNSMLTHYYELLSRPRESRPAHLQTESAVLAHVAKQYGTKGPVLKQQVLKHKGRLGKGKPIGRRW